MHDKVMGQHKHVSLKPMQNVKELIVTVTLDLVTWFLFATHYIVMIITYAKLFTNPIMHDKFMNWTRTGFTEAYAQSLSANCDLDH